MLRKRTICQILLLQVTRRGFINSHPNKKTVPRMATFQFTKEIQVQSDIVSKKNHGYGILGSERWFAS